MDDTSYYLDAAQAQQGRLFGIHWATFWTWCITTGGQPLPAAAADVHAWLRSLECAGVDVEVLHLALLQIAAAHEAHDLPVPAWYEPGEPS